MRPTHPTEEVEVGASPQVATGLSSLRDDADKSSSPKASIPSVAHTPGPWRAVGSHIVSETAFEDYEDSNGNPIRICVADLYGAMSGNSAADTRLIVAAPELFDALQVILARIDHWFDGDEREIALARAAIAKATGR